MRVREHLELCDKVTFWTWDPEELKDLEENFSRVEELAPSCGKLIGCYMWDYFKKNGLLPDAAKEKPQRGKVISVGEGRLLDDGSNRKMSVKKGDQVLFTSYAGTEVKISGTEYMIMNESDIMAIIEG